LNVLSVALSVEFSVQVDDFHLLQRDPGILDLRRDLSNPLGCTVIRGIERQFLALCLFSRFAFVP